VPQRVGPRSCHLRPEPARRGAPVRSRNGNAVADHFLLESNVLAVMQVELYGESKKTKTARAGKDVQIDLER
jgi:hypothetical protein